MSFARFSKAFLLACLLSASLLISVASQGDGDTHILHRRAHPKGHTGTTARPCVTIRGVNKPKDGKVVTLTRTNTLPVQKPDTIRAHATFTVTPKPSTVLRTDTQTVITTSTVSEATDVLTVHATPIIIETSTITSTASVTVNGETVTITSTDTIVIPTAEGFTPLAAQISAAGHTPGAAMRRRGDGPARIAKAQETWVQKRPTDEDDVKPRRDCEEKVLPCGSKQYYKPRGNSAEAKRQGKRGDGVTQVARGRGGRGGHGGHGGKGVLSTERQPLLADPAFLKDTGYDAHGNSLLAPLILHRRNVFDSSNVRLHVQSVVCTKTVAQTATRHPHTIVVGPPRTVIANDTRVTLTITTVLTLTSTVAPPHVTSTTTLTLAPATVTTTTTTATTNTATVLPTAVVDGLPVIEYAACAADNLVGTIDGNYLGGSHGTYNQAAHLVASRQECCARCQDTPDCIFFASPSPGFCIIYTPSPSPAKCPLPYTLQADASVTIAGSAVCGNGVCGQITF